jgi:dTMP kinase
MGFIVIEGLDGSGKSTQVELLKAHLCSEHKNFEFVHFPTYNSEIYGELITRFLNGDFGSINNVDPYLVALIFAGDRYNMSKTISGWLKEGKTVINDRYVYSNIGFQCAKLKDNTEQDKLFDWILNLEYNYFKIPKPDLSIFLDVPFEFTKQSLQKNRQGNGRGYLKTGNTDIHETDLNFQKTVRETYLKAIERDENFILLDCSDDNNLILKPKIISAKIIDEIKKRSLL